MDFENKLTELSYDLKYKSYLISANHDLDKLSIIIDRDTSSHSVQNMKDCIDYCEKKNYKLYISNPCFEFWLLLHLSDVKLEYHDQLNSIQKNEKVSNHNTFIGKIVSEKTHAKKAIINSNFENNYLPNIDKAIKRSQNFSTELLDLIDNLGSLKEEMRHFEE